MLFGKYSSVRVKLLLTFSPTSDFHYLTSSLGDCSKQMGEGCGPQTTRQLKSYVSSTVTRMI
jgi:hypothetical protein